MRYFYLLSLLLFIVFYTFYSDKESAEFHVQSAKEAPFFVVDRYATGPLTLDELQINIPKKINAELTESKRACFFNAVKKRALEAGNPETLDPNDFPYWNGKTSLSDWNQQSNYMKRVLLAQAIISWAMIDC